MAKELQVYGGLIYKGGRQRRTVVAANSKAEVARLTGLPISEIRGYWSQTRNDAQVTAAMSEPGTVFQAANSRGETFTALPSLQIEAEPPQSEQAHSASTERPRG